MALLIPLAAAGAQGALAGQTQRVELASKRTEHSRTFLNSDGTFSTEISVLPVSYTDESGRLRPVDTALVADSDGYKAAKNSLSVDFGSKAGNLFKLTKKDEADIEVTVGAAGSLEETMTPTKDGPSHLTYKSYKKGAKLSYRILPGRLKEEITLADPTTDTAFSFDLSLKNLTPVRRRGGSIALENPAGKTSLTIEAPFMMDQNSIYGTPDTYSSYDIEMTLEHKQGALYTLTLVPSTAWLTDPTRIYPVVIDPTFTVPDRPSQDTWIWAGDPDHPHPTWYRMLVGGWSPTNQTKSLVQFDLSSIPRDAQVSSATLRLTHVPMTESNINSGEYGTGNTYTRVYRVTEGWQDETATWNEAPAYNTTVIDQKTVDDPNFSVLDLVRNWVKGANGNYGFMLDNTSEIQLLNNTYPGGTLDPDPWSWTTSNPHSADKAHREPNASGYHRHLYQSGPDFFIPKNSQIRTWVYPSGIYPTDEVMLQFKIGSWEHRAYWGANSISLGTNGTDSRRYTGSLPASGGWRDIWVKSTDVGIDDTNLTGMAFSLYNGYAVFDEVSNWRTQNFYTMEAGSGNPTLTLTYSATSLGKEDWKTYHEYSGVEVDLQTGNLMVENTDVAIPGRGLGATISRTYNSQDASASIYGVGWRSYPDSVRVTAGASSAAVYTQSGAIHHYLKSGSAYIRPPGVTDDLTKNPDGAFVLVRKDLGKTNFDSAGRISSEVDRNGNTTTFTYGANGHVSTITDPSGRTTTVSYNGSNLVSQVTDFAARTVLYSYTSGRLTQVTDQSGAATSYAYDANGKLQYVTNPLGGVTTLAYDSEGKATTVANPLGSTTTFSYVLQNVADETDTPQIEGTKTTVTDPRGYPTTYYFTGFAPGGRLCKKVDPIGATPNPTTDETDFPHDEEVEDVALEEYAEFTADMTAEGLAPQELSNEAGWTAATRYEYDADYNVVKETDKNGEVTTRTYDSRANELSSTDGNGTTYYRYDSNSNLLNETSPAGSVTSYTYDSKGNQLTETDSESNTTSYAYDSYGNQVTVTQPRGNEPGGAGHYTTTNSYDAYGNLTRTTDPMGVTTDSTYDALGRRLSETPEGMNPTTYAYDAMGRVLKEIGPTITREGTASTHSENWSYYDGAGNKTKSEVYEAIGAQPTLRNWTESAYNAAGQPTSVTSYASDRQGGQTTTYAHDGNGNKLTETNPSGGVTSYEYDALNRLTKETSSGGDFNAHGYDGEDGIVKQATGGGTYVTLYDHVGNEAARTGPDGTSEKGCFDSEGNEIRTADTSGSVTKNLYDDNGNIIGVTDPASGRTSYTYDRNENETGVTSTAGTTVTTNLNYADQVVGEIDQNKRVTTTAYDSAGLDSLIESPNRKDTAMTYNQAGNLTSQDATDVTTNSASVDTTYNAFGNPVSAATTIQGAVGPATKTDMTYGSDGRLKTMKDLSGFTTSFSYDNAGNLYRIGDTTAAYATYGYDTSGTGRLTSITDSNNDVTSVDYNQSGNVLRTGFPNGTDTRAMYDSASRATRIYSRDAIFEYIGSSNLFYTYDNLNGNLDSVEIAGDHKDVFADFDAGHWTLDSTQGVHHDQVRQYMVMGPTQSEIGFHGRWWNWYDYYLMKADFKVETHPATGSSAATVSIKQADPSTRTARLKQDGTVLTFENVTPSGTSTSTLDVTYAIGSWYTVEFELTPLRIYLYVYPRGEPRPTLAASYTAGPPNMGSPMWSFRGRTGTTYIDNEGVYNERPETTYYQYDNQDRLTRVVNPDRSVVRYTYDSQGNRLTKTINGTYTTSYYYSPANELTRAVSPAGTTTYTYDENGNTVSKTQGATTTTYAYDNFDQLVSIKKTGEETISYTYDANGNRYSKKVGGTITRYHYDGSGNILAETDATGAATVKYTRDDNGKAISMIQGAHTYYMIYNAHGDVVALTDEYGSTVATYSYDEFGNITSEAGSVYNPLRYAAAYNSYYDTETGFYKMGVRYYDPQVGRWKTRDSFLGESVEPLSHNRYAYCLGNPLAHVDPTGRKAWKSKKWPWPEKKWYKKFKSHALAFYPNYMTRVNDNGGDDPKTGWSLDCADYALAGLMTFAKANRLRLRLKAWGKLCDSDDDKYPDWKAFFIDVWDKLDTAACYHKDNDNTRMYKLWKTARAGDLLLYNKIGCGDDNHSRVVQTNYIKGKRFKYWAKTGSGAWLVENESIDWKHHDNQAHLYPSTDDDPGKGRPRRWRAFYPKG